MARDFSYPHETMPKETDAEFVEMVRVSTVTGVWCSEWMGRIVRIAERGAQTRPAWADRFIYFVIGFLSGFLFVFALTYL